MGGRREVSIIFYRPVTRSDLKQERSFFRGSVSSFLQLVVAVFPAVNKYSYQYEHPLSNPSYAPGCLLATTTRLHFVFPFLFKSYNLSQVLIIKTLISTRKAKKLSLEGFWEFLPKNVVVPRAACSIVKTVITQATNIWNHRKEHIKKHSKGQEQFLR